MESLDGQHFDVVVIGAGMSGLTAGIRLAMYGKRVIILERHNVVGGLNSFYSFDGRKYDVGLHALTNFVREGVKRLPLPKILRQLRISREEFDLCEQNQSRIAFPGVDLSFSNDLELLREEISKKFPTQIDSFNKLVEHIRVSFREYQFDDPHRLARPVLAQFIEDPLLREMILTPLFLYGNAREDDMFWEDFVVLFHAIYLEGFARPFEGVRQILRVLTKKFKSHGGIRKMKTGVRKILTQGNKVTGVELDSGEVILTKAVISSMGYLETMEACGGKVEYNNTGKISLVETMAVFKDQPKSWGWEDTIVFFNDSETFHYRRPQDLVDPRSGVICFPNNYKFGEGRVLEEGTLRVSALANFNAWSTLAQEVYLQKKSEWFDKLFDKVLSFLPTIDRAAFNKTILATDMFTPRTVRKYTSHIEGALYGSPKKIREGLTHLENLFICGADQGMVGVTGTMLSGIAMANTHILAKL